MEDIRIYKKDDDGMVFMEALSELDWPATPQRGDCIEVAGVTFRVIERTFLAYEATVGMGGRTAMVVGARLVIKEIQRADNDDNELLKNIMTSIDEDVLDPDYPEDLIDKTLRDKGIDPA